MATQFVGSNITRSLAIVFSSINILQFFQLKDFVIQRNFFKKNLKKYVFVILRNILLRLVRPGMPQDPYIFT